MQDQRHVVVMQPCRHRQVEHLPRPLISDRAGARPAVRLMRRYQQRVGVLRKGMFDPVRVMRVNIHVGHALRPVAPQRLDRQHRIVEIAKPVRAVGQAVMGAACGRIDDATDFEQLAREQRPTRRRGRTAEHFRKDRIGRGAKPVARAHRVADGLGRFCRLQRGQVGGGVEPRQGRDLGARTGDELRRWQPSQRARQVHHRGHARHPQRVPRPIGRAAIDFSADKLRQGACSC